MSIDPPRTIVASAAAVAVSAFGEASDRVPQALLDGTTLSSDEISQPGLAARPAGEAA
jgi:hypothetical protein